MRRLIPLFLAPLLLLASCAQEPPPPAPQKPIPALTADQQAQLAEAQDFRHSFDDGPLYALLASAVTWPRDAFGGAAPLAIHEQVNPVTRERTPVLALLEKPEAHRGEAMLIEGMLIAKDQGVPNNVGGQLSRPDPQWGSTLSWWVIRMGRSERDPQVIVFFPADGRPLPEAKLRSQVKVAARFYKVFTAEVYVQDPTNTDNHVQTGREEPFVAFVGGAAEISRNAAIPIPMAAKAATLLFLIALGFGGVWFIRTVIRGMSRDRTFKSPAQRWAERLEREREEGAPEEDDDMDLPQDPAEALRKLGGGK